jgi:exodeoxyribonuclease V alpha subunit
VAALCILLATVDLTALVAAVDSEEGGSGVSLEVTALLQKIIYASPDGNFLVAEFIDGRTAKRFKASGKAFTLGKQDAQQRYKLFGDWVQSPKYGETFQVLYAEPQRPDTLKGIVPFLVNNVKGVGEATANKLLDALEVRTLEEFVRLCKEEPTKILSHFKEGKRKLGQAIVTLVTGDEVYRSIMVFLHEHGIPPGFAQRIYERYGAEALRILTENPYRLISDFRNVGFLRADAIAQKMGVPPNSPFRMEAAFIHALEKATDEGHCCLPRDFLVEKAQTVLSNNGKDPDFTFDYVLACLRSLYKKNKDEGNERFILRLLDAPESPERKSMLFYLPELYRLENAVAAHCLRMMAKDGIGAGALEGKLSAGELGLSDLVPDIPWSKLSDEQRGAVDDSVHNRMMVLTGGPGCGKTFVLKAIYRVQRALGRRVALCAPTGLAAKRMTQSIEAQASTLHKLLRIGQRTKNGTEDGSSPGGEAGAGLGNAQGAPLEAADAPLDNIDVVIVDESSMLSLDLLNVLLESMPASTRLVLVGDVDQLPSVGAGNCLRDIISSGAVPVTRLTKIFRQGKESPIPLAAREIISGNKPEFTFTSRSYAFPAPEAFALIPCSQQTFFDALLPFLHSTVRGVYGLDPKKDVQILVPMRRGEAGQEKINTLLQKELNPPREDAPEVTLPNGVVLRVGDKVMQTRNNYEKEVFNGDLGYVSAIVATSEKREVDVAFVDKTVRLEDEEAEDLQLCYAMTIHKSQGSEFPLCIIPMFSSYYTMLDRNLLYTAVTRGSRFVVLLGEEWAIRKAVGSTNAMRRFTALESLLRQGFTT